jgi:hypothetical protein
MVANAIPMMQMKGVGSIVKELKRKLHLSIQIFMHNYFSKMKAK